MEPKKTYRNALRSRAMIRAAFTELLHEKPFERITATDIVKRADINRSTFYAHYPDVAGIMDEITGEVRDLFSQMLQTIDMTTFLSDPEPLLRQVIVFLQENEELYRLLGRSAHSCGQLEQLKQVLIRQVLDTPSLLLADRSSPQSQIAIRLLLGGIIDAYRDWLSGEIDCSLEEMSATVIRIVSTWLHRSA